MEFFLVPHQSPWNIPVLLVKKPGTIDYQQVRDLREVNKWVEDIYPIVSNPYTLLNTLNPEHQAYSVLDLKDTFYSLTLDAKSQPIFTLEWNDPDQGFSRQLTWTCSPQRFKNSPTIFNDAFYWDLKEYWASKPKISLLRYMDDQLIVSSD